MCSAVGKKLEGKTDVIASGTQRPAILSLGHLDSATWALGGGGLLFGLGNLLHPLQHVDASFQSPTWAASHLAIFFSLPLLMLGMPSLGQALSRRGAGPIGRAAVLLAVIGMIGMAPGLLAEAYIAPEIGTAAMEHFEATGFGAIGALLSTVWIASSMVLAAACHRANFGPTWARVVLAGVAIALFLGAVPGPLGGCVVIIATAAYGAAVAVLGWELGPR